MDDSAASTFRWPDAAPMTAVLTGKIARLVRIDKAGGAIFEFWVEMPGGGGAVRATEAIAGSFREGDEVVVEGNRSPEGVLDAARISGVVPKQSTLPFWLLPPYRLLLVALPVTALVTYAMLASYVITTTVDRPGSDNTIPFLVIGVALFMYARLKIRHLQLRLVAKTAGITMIGTALASAMVLTDLQTLFVVLTSLAAFVGGVLVVTFILLERKRATKAAPTSAQPGR